MTHKLIRFSDGKYGLARYKNNHNIDFLSKDGKGYFDFPRFVARFCKMSKRRAKKLQKKMNISYEVIDD